MIYGVEYGQRNPSTDPVTYYGFKGGVGTNVNRRDAAKFFDRVEAETMVAQNRGMLPTDPMYADSCVIILDATMERDTLVQSIVRHRIIPIRGGAECHVWELLYDNGETRIAEWVNPPAGALSILPGSRFVDHCFAVKNKE